MVVVCQLSSWNCLCSIPDWRRAGPRECVTGAGSESIEIALHSLKGLDVLDCVCIDFFIVLEQEGTAQM